MARVAILGGGIAGLAAVYELEKQRRAGKPIDWHLFEASDRLGGTVSTTRFQTPEGEYILEDGPDGWVTEKPWARELAQELGLSGEIISCNESGKKTYLWLDGRLVSMPDRMRLMVLEDLSALDDSPLFSEEAKAAYRDEVNRAEHLKASATHRDESVASFVRRHFGDEVLAKIGAPLLSGVFGGDVEMLSVLAVMPAFVQMDAEDGSLSAALQARARERGNQPRQPTFTSLRRGMGSLVDALVAELPSARLHTRMRAVDIGDESLWCVGFQKQGRYRALLSRLASREIRDGSGEQFDHLLLATPGDETRRLLATINAEVAAFVPSEASSAVLVTFCWNPAVGQQFALPPGFGFLVPHQGMAAPNPKLLAGTFSAQKFPNRAPEGARILRVFFGGEKAESLNGFPNQEIADEAWRELGVIFAGLPYPLPALTTVRYWPRSLPQYEVGHLERMAELERRVAALGKIQLIGNSYHGVGVPDLIRDARAAARNLAESLN